MNIDSILTLDKWLCDFNKTLSILICAGASPYFSAHPHSPVIMPNDIKALIKQSNAKRTFKNGRAGHHKGSIYQLLNGNTNYNQIQNWVNDLTHGLFHGYCTSFWTLYPERDINDLIFSTDISEIESLIISSLVHDYAKCQGFCEKDHDIKLKNYFEKLHNSTYCHSSNPDRSDKLVIADRIELMRFADHDQWIDLNKLQIDGPTLDACNLFYKHFRPALKLLFEYRNSIWLRHSCEEQRHYKQVKISEFDESYFPSKFWDPLNGFWSVEYGRPPFRGRILYTGNIDDSYDTEHKCSPFGVVPLDKMKDVEICHMPHRDHLAAKGNYKPSEWIFLFDGIKDLQARSDLLTGSYGFMSIELANTTVEVMDSIINAIILLHHI